MFKKDTKLQAMKYKIAISATIFSITIIFGLTWVIISAWGDLVERLEIKNPRTYTVVTNREVLVGLTNLQANSTTATLKGKNNEAYHFYGSFTLIEESEEDGAKRAATIFNNENTLNDN